MIAFLLILGLCIWIEKSGGNEPSDSDKDSNDSGGYGL